MSMSTYSSGGIIGSGPEEIFLGTLKILCDNERRSSLAMSHRSRSSRGQKRTGKRTVLQTCRLDYKQYKREAVDPESNIVSNN